MIELRHLRCFLCISRERTITKAADVLHISQPALSRTLQELEDELGQKLIIRNKPITLTPKGELLRRRAETMIDYFEKLKKEIKADDSDLSGTITLAVGESPSIDFLAHCMRKLRELHPHITFDIKSGNECDVIAELDNQTADFGVLIASPKAAEYQHLILPMRDTWSLIIPSEHELAQKERICPEDLADLPLIMSSQAQYNRDFSGWLGTVSAKLHIVGNYNLPYNGYIFAKRCRLCMLVLADLVEISPEDKMQIRPLLPVLDAQLHLVWNSDIYVSPLCKSFLDMVKTQLTLGFN